MDKIELSIILSLVIRTVICSNYENAVFNDPELNYTDIVNTNTVGYQVTNSLNSQDNASQNVHRDMIQNLKNFSNEHTLIFNRNNHKGLVRLNRLSKIHGFTWQDTNQSVLNNVRIILFNHDSNEIVNYFRNLKKQLSFVRRDNNSCLKKTVDTAKLKDSCEMPHKTTKEHFMVAYHSTVDEYVSELKKVFDKASSVRLRSPKKIAMQKVFRLMSDVININDYANHKNIIYVTRNELDTFCSICARIKYKYFSKLIRIRNFSDCITKLYVNSLQLFCETRKREKCLLLPEFFCLYDYVQRFYIEKHQLLNFHKVLIIYIVSKIEINISKMIILKKANIEMEDTIQEGLVTYRSFTREVLISTLLQVLHVDIRHVCEYIMTSRLEYSYFVMRGLQCADYKVVNFYNIVFFIFSTFTVKFNILQTKFLKSKIQNCNDISYIYYNRICLSLFSHRSKEFKETLKKGIQKIFSSRIFKFAQFKNLQRSICTQIDGLDENNCALMILKVNTIYNYIRNRLLVEE